MRRSCITLAVAACLFACQIPCHVQAGKYNTTVNIGDKAPAWNDLEGTEGEQHSLGDVADAKVVVVAFTCNSCPYAVDVEDRLNRFTQKTADRGVAVVAINVNKVEADQLPAMKQRDREKGLAYPYLWDPSQQIAKDFGAKYTPEFFVLDEDRKIVYMGSFDDSPDGKNVTKTYVADAVNAVLEGHDLGTTETVPIGCRIRFERQRRGR